jgi:hypothetical protein
MRTAYLSCYHIRDDKRPRRVFKTSRDSRQQRRFSVLDCSISRPDSRPDLAGEIALYSPFVTR